MAKRKQASSVRRGGGHGMAWFLAGAVAGGLVTWAAIGRDPAAEQVRATVGKTVGHPIGVDSDAPPPKPKFEFYTLLPEMEVVVPDEDLATRQPAESGSASESDATGDAPAGSENAPGDADPALKSGHYVLQVASFKSMKEADGLKAKLSLLGFEPVVQSVAINSDENWYRVRIGPYKDRESLESARIRLRADGHDSPLVVWVKKG